MTFRIFLSFLIMCGVFGTEDDEGKTLSVKEGDSVTLNPDLNETQGFNLIQWRFGGEGSTIARTDGNEISYANDERFRDRLQLNDQTGSLTITNMKNTDSGLYRVTISSSKPMINKRFIVTVSSGVSPGAVAEIFVVFLLVMVIVVFYYRRKTSELKKRRDEKTVIVKKGDDVTLHTDVDMEEMCQILWTFEALDARIAEIRDGTRETFDAAGGTFRDRLMLDETGSLTIRNIETRHHGAYILQINRSRRRRWPLYKRFNVFVNDRTISVMEGDDLTLNSGTELNKDKQIKWLFGGISSMEAPIAEINGETGEIFTYEGKAGGRFRNRLKLDPLTGSLTIRNTGPEHFGFYERQIKKCGGSSHTIFMVSISERTISVEEEKNVTLEIDSEIQTDDQILWMFGAEETLIAQIKGENRETHDVADERFRDRLKLEESGSLTISNITAEHTGAYKAQIISRGTTSYKKFKVAMLAEYVPVRKGDDVTLHTDSKIQRSDQIRWMFGDKNLIAEIKEGTGEMATYNDVLEGRFRGRLKLDEQTGSLTITNFRTDHTGLYKMKINRSAGKSKNRSFDVFARGESLHSVY
ncbi:uncharacterized protein LOC132159053 isoform X2 [Carassius carassius]|uniref:uncharacterized protein LOC132159053 isoform X2 n=1 Tax=Carassius carassius TaxID=217509 RepID=UPI002868477B|nr:uncharacterized protein LOC132159053 isoform X2 [Carassius carassius]